MHLGKGSESSFYQCLLQLNLILAPKLGFEKGYKRYGEFYSSLLLRLCLILFNQSSTCFSEHYIIAATLELNLRLIHLRLIKVAITASKTT